MYKIKNQRLKQDSGITLVALIITIIVLIILATVSIKAVLDMNFVDLASNAAINYAEAQAEEDKQMKDMDDFLQSTIKKIEDNDFNTGGENTPNPSNNPNPTPEPTPDGPHMPVIPEASDKAGIYVNYEPKSGAYLETILSKYSGNNNNGKFSTDSSLKWRVLSIDNTYL